jgi:hypothetical protein
MRQVLFGVGMMLAPLALASPSLAQHHHPPEDADVHEKFYRTWRMPEHDWSCCDNRDCYPTEVRIVGGDIFAKRREDERFIAIPAAKVDRKRDNRTAAATSVDRPPQRRRIRPTLCSASSSAPACKALLLMQQKKDGYAYVTPGGPYRPPVRGGRRAARRSDPAQRAAQPPARPRGRRARPPDPCCAR